MRTVRTPTGLLSLPRHLAQRTIWIVTAFGCAAFAGYIFLQIGQNLAGDRLPLNDFFAIWSFAKYAVANGAQGIYDAPSLHGFMLTLDGTLRQQFPYPYPPSFLLMIWPIGLMSHMAAYFVWTGITLALYLIASFEKERPWTSLAVAFAPAAMVDLYLGQTGFLSSALIVGGFRLAGSRPILAGILFGLVSFKPQLGLLLPVALIAARQWRAIVSTAGTIALLVVASGMLFGWASWLEWLSALPGHSQYVEQAVNNHYKATVTATLEMAGLSAGLAHLAQAAASLVVAAIVWACFRRRADGLAPAALEAGTFLAAPYAFFYDLPMLTNATLAAAFQRNRQIGVAESAILALSLLFPIVMLLTWRLWPIPLPAITLLFALIVRRILRA